MHSMNSRVRSCLKDLICLAICLASATGLQMAFSADTVEQDSAASARRRPEIEMPGIRASADAVDQLFAEISQLRQEVRRLRELLEGKSLPREEQESPASREGKESGAFMLYFHARWCGPCQQMNPVIARLRREGLPIRSIDVDAEPGLVKQYGVTAIPLAVMVFDGKEADRIRGTASESQLRELLRPRNERAERVRAVKAH